MITDSNIRINRDLCIACGACVDRCIMDNLRLSLAPCRQACPLQTNCQGYVRLSAAGKDKEAAEELRKHTLFGRILGRVCTHPCESACTRAVEVKDGAVHIRAIKRFLADKYPEITDAPPCGREKTGKKTAIVGSGPAGMEAAMRLAEAGHEVTVFERDARPGGTLRYGVPSFRLPEAELDRVVASLEAGGVTFVCNTAINSTEKLVKDFDAVIISGGAPESISIPMPGADLPGVVSGLEFLRAAHSGTGNVKGKRVVVIGGGATAVDAAISAKRLGAVDVAIVCLEARRDMPLADDARVELDEEALTIHDRSSVSAINAIKNEGGNVGLNLALRRCLSLFDENGSFAPELDAHACLADMQADLVIISIGQRPEQNTFADLKHLPGGALAMEPLTCRAPGQTRIFIAGDCASGPSSVVEAMASGKEAALSVCRLLAGETLESARDPYALHGWSKTFVTCTKNAAATEARGKEPRLPLRSRGVQTEDSAGFSPEQIRKEAERCLACGRSFESKKTCWFCLPCEVECPQKALEVRIPYLSR